MDRNSFCERVLACVPDDFAGKGDLSVGSVAFAEDQQPGLTVSDQRTFWGTVGLARVDEEGEVILPAGGEFSYFNRYPTVYLNHDHDVAVGKCQRVRVSESSVRCFTYLSRSSVGEDVRIMVNEGVLKGLSWGALRIDSGPPTDQEAAQFPGARRVTRTWQPVEYSVTGMPCLAGADIDQKAMATFQDGLDRLVRKGRVLRESAVKAGLDATPTRQSFRIGDLEITTAEGGPALPPPAVDEDGNVWG